VLRLSNGANPNSYLGLCGATIITVVVIDVVVAVVVAVVVVGTAGAALVVFAQLCVN